jgi:hypothetical protein
VTEKTPIPMTEVESSNVHSYGYDANTKTLAVRFHDGGLYHYSGVSGEVIGQMAKAKSFGSFIHAHIKGKHEGKKV